MAMLKPLLQAASVVMIAASAQAQPAPGVLQELSGCVALMQNASVLRTAGGNELYVEPTAVSRAGDARLVAGTPNYVYPGRATAPDQAAANSVFGVILTAAGTARMVPLPLTSGRITSVRAAAAGPRRWHVVFAELPRDHVFPDPERGAKLWYAELRDTVWGPVAALELPPVDVLYSHSASELVAHGDTLWWAVSYGSAGKEGQLLYRRSGGTWTMQDLRITDASYAALAYHSERGLELVAVRRGDVPGEGNSIFLHRGAPDWREVRLLARGNNRPIRASLAGSTPRQTVLTYAPQVGGIGRRRMTARAITGDLGDPGSGVISIHPDVLYVTAVAHSGQPIWLVVQEGAQQDTELRLLTQGRDSAVTIGTFANPFTGPFGVSAGDSSLSLIGPLLRQESGTPVVVSQLREIRLSCRSPNQSANVRR